jgi:lipopolysaccharide transport system permease protein
MGKLQLACKDISGGLKHWRIWMLLGWLDIRLKYRRSAIGPFWIAISTGIMIYSLGFIYAHLFHQDLKVYFPFLATGLVSWAFISMVILESNDAFVSAQTYIKQLNLPFTTYIFKMLMRNFIVLLHNLIPLIPILLYFHMGLSPLSCIALLAGVFLLLLLGFAYGTIIAIIGTRYRDTRQVIESVVQIIFLGSAIMWRADMLPPKYQMIMSYNPFHVAVELIRGPLLGAIPSLHMYLYALCLLAVGLVLQFYLLGRSCTRIAFWV